jgi:hypothetical protein
MLSRVGVVSLQHCQRQRLLHHAGNLAAVSLTGISLYATSSSTQLEGALKFDNVGDLIVPTMEATARALRLISTAVLIVTDYESAKITTKLFPEQNPERVRWEQEKQARRQELEDAQIAYTSPKPVEMVAKSGKSRQAFIVDQKESVHLAAERLAEAEEELATLGDRKSEVHKKAANRLLELCRRNGGVYIKIGQHLANLDYLIPQEYTEALSSLFDDTPRSCKYPLLQLVLLKLPSDVFFPSLQCCLPRHRGGFGQASQ